MRDALNIGALASEVGIPAETLRTWERRYGFPNSSRTDTGHRRYDDEVRKKLIYVRELLDGGHKPSIVLKWSIEELESAVGKLSSGEPESTVTVDVQIQKAIEHARALDSRSLERSFLSNWNERSAMDFLENFAGPYLRQVGEMWRNEEITIAQEHLASEVMVSFLSSRWREMEGRNAGQSVVCATPAGERHVLGLHFVALTFALEGFRIVFLGADVPASDICLVAASESVSAVALSISSGANREDMLREIESVRAGLKNIPILIGGSGAPRKLRGVHSLASLRDARKWISSQV